MKYRFFSLLFLASSLVCLGACNSSNQKISINIFTKEIEATEIGRYEDLSSMISSEENEDFLLATYSKKQSTGCSCWSGFKFDVLDKFVKSTNIPIYYFDTDKLTGRDQKFGISQLVKSEPEFYIFRNGKKMNKFSGNGKFFKNPDYFNEEMEKIIEKPQYQNLFYVNEDYIDANLSTADSAVVLTERDGCPDCRYVMPHVVVPYANLAKFKREIWVLNIQSYMDTEKYDAIKEKMKLTAETSEYFGYKTGVVPTIQYYQNGLLLDAAVYFNDKVENGVISETYYTEERLPYLSFLNNSNVETKVLKGLPVSEEHILYGSYLDNETATKYHDPIFKQFLKTYCL